MSANCPHTSSGLSRLFGLLSAPRRWYVLRILHEVADESVEVSYLARQITSIQEGIKPDNATGGQYENRYNALIQTHLPQLEDAQIIDYDAARKTVSPGPLFDSVQMFMFLAVIGYDHFDYEIPARDNETSPQ